MATTTQLITLMPQAWTITLTSNDVLLDFRSDNASSVGKHASSLVITNLDTSAELYIRFTSDADSASNHYTLLAWQSINLDFRKEGTQNCRICWTSWKKFSYLIN